MDTKNPEALSVHVVPSTNSPDISSISIGPIKTVSQNSTETHIFEVDLLHLSIQQQNAIDLLVTGCSDRETADKAGVTRSTVTRWRLYHPAFRAELNAQRAAVWGQARERLRALIPEAVEAIAEAIRDPSNPDRAKLALDLLRSVKVSDGLSSIDSRTDPAAMMREEAYVPSYATLNQATDYQIVRHIGQLQARLNGLSDNEYNEAVDAADDREAAQERAQRKAAREAKKKAALPTLELQQPTPSPSAAIAIPDEPDEIKEPDRYPAGVR